MRLCHGKARIGEKRRGPISENARNQVWVFPELLVYSNSDYVHAIFPIALSLFWGKGGAEICLSRPLSVVFAILSHRLNTTATNNYSVRTKGKWSCGDTILKGSAPVAPLEDFGKYPDGPNPRIASETAPGAFRNSLFALILAKLRSKAMSWGGGPGARRSFGDGISRKRTRKKGYRKVNLLSGFVTSGGKSLSADLLLVDFDLKRIFRKGK